MSGAIDLLSPFRIPPHESGEFAAVDDFGVPTDTTGTGSWSMPQGWYDVDFHAEVLPESNMDTVRIPVIAPAPTKPAPRRPEPVRPGADPFDEVRERFHDVAAAATHPFEIAAVLEAEGLTDEQIRRRYGRSDAFELADELYAAVTRHSPEPDPQPDPWRTNPLRSFLRGALFALPGAAFVVAAPFFHGPKDPFGLPCGTIALLVAGLVSWAWSQGLAHRAYAHIAIGAPRAAGRVLLRGALIGSATVAVLVLAVTLAIGSVHTDDPTPMAPALFTIGQSVYLFAATILLTVRQARFLVLALIPVVFVALLVVAADWLGLDGPSGGLRTLALLSGLALAVGAAWWAVRRLLRRAASSEVGGPRLRASLPYALFGGAVGSLVLALGFGDLITGGTAAESAAPAAALSLSMGVAEWFLYSFRSRMLRVLRRTESARTFAHRAAVTLLTSLAGYLACVHVFALIIGHYALGLSSLPAERTAGLLALAALLWTALLLQACGSAGIAAAVCVTAGVVESVLLMARHQHPDGVLSAPQALVAVCVPAAIGLTAYACLTLGQVTRHR